MNACFRLGGSSSVKVLTVEGVEALDSLPVLHLSLGAAPQDFVVKSSGDQGLQSFHRIIDERKTESIQSFNKKSLTGKASIDKVSYKRPKLRMSKQQSMEDVLADLGGGTSGTAVDI